MRASPAFKASPGVSTVRRRLLHKVHCPHCWHTFRTEETLWVAAHPELRGDPLLSPDEPIRFLPSRFAVSGEALDEHGSRCQRLACPRCHLGIPPALMEHAIRIFSLVGSPGSGKSYFLAAAAWQMRQKLPTSFALAFADADPLCNRIISENEERLFLQDDPERLVYIEKTELAGAQYDSVQFDPGEPTLFPHPFLFTIRPMRDHVNGHGADVLSEVLCLYDNAGEHFLPGADTPNAPGTQHLARSKNLFMVFDPLQDVRFRASLRGKVADPQLGQSSRAFRQDVVLQEMVDRVRRYGGLSSDARVRQPLTVIVTKSDAWGPLLMPGVDIVSDPYTAEARANGRRIGRVDKSRVEAVSAQVESIIRDAAPEFAAVVRDSSERVLYVPVSAIGSSPELDAGSGLLKVRPRDIRPSWVTVPFLYEFSRWGRIVGRVEDRSDEPMRGEAPGEEPDDGA